MCAKYYSKNTSEINWIMQPWWNIWLAAVNTSVSCLFPFFLLLPSSPFLLPPFSFYSSPCCILYPSVYFISLISLPQLPRLALLLLITFTIMHHNKTDLIIVSFHCLAGFWTEMLATDRLDLLLLYHSTGKLSSCRGLTVHLQTQKHSIILVALSSHLEGYLYTIRTTNLIT